MNKLLTLAGILTFIAIAPISSVAAVIVSGSAFSTAAINAIRS